MTDSGYFTFWGKAVLVHDWHETRSQGNAYDNGEIWAIVVGRRKELNRDPETWTIVSTPKGDPIPAGVYELTLVLVEHHGYGLFHRVGMEHEIDERKTVDWDWKYREFHVGGLGRGERVRFAASLEGLTYKLVGRDTWDDPQVLVP
ncbi:hypothetical protein DFS33DRAFT_1387100 [Desarmillaria ectypa]|nr:hypothetical protein DFS33DRAFT_1387100 [Desarmillaria ectypa]